MGKKLDRPTVERSVSEKAKTLTLGQIKLLSAAEKSELLECLSAAEKRDLLKRLESEPARSELRPAVQVARTLREISSAYEQCDLYGLIDALEEQTDLAKGGDLSRAEEMLAAQAHTLDAIYNNFSRNAVNSDHLDKVERLLRLALRAQVQCRETWQALAALKNPPVMNVRQANIANGPQQVNNTLAVVDAAPQPQGGSIAKIKVLETERGKRLDARAPSAAVSIDQAMAAVGKVDGAEVG